ncbi:MAG: c-type cytochrome [Acidimicrobiia bacterium]
MRWRIVLVAGLALVLGACGGTDEGGGEPVDGEALFSQTVLEGRAGCTTCHSLQEGVALVGPSLAGVGARAGDRVPGLSGKEYLRQSILDPDAYVVEPYSAGVMQSWDGILSDAQVDALVSYLLSLQ